MIPTSHKTIQAVFHNPVIRSVWLVTPQTPGKKPLANWSEQPESSKTMVVASGTMAHLKRLLTGENDPSAIEILWVLV